MSDRSDTGDAPEADDPARAETLDPLAAETLPEPPPAPAEEAVDPALAETLAQGPPPAPGELALAETLAEPSEAGAPEPAGAAGEAPAAGGAGGETIDGYELLGELARGGMGVVYRARDPELGREVALKVLLPGSEGQPQAHERFAIEARAAARLQHPHVVPIHRVGRHQGRPYLVMDLIRGRSLAERLAAEGPLPPREAARIALALARALAYAHARAILHRDLKPGNVLLDEEGEPILTDFGLAKEVGSEAAGVTGTGQLLGTPAYMAPEQAEGRLEAIDRRADVYGLGAVLYALLCGRPPFQGSVLQVLRAVLTRPPAPPRTLRPELARERDLETICLRCLEKEPEARYGTAGELASDLERYLRHEPIHARRPGLLERAGKWRRRNQAAARAGGAVLLAALLVGAIGTSLFVARLRRERDAVARRARMVRRALDTLVVQVRQRLAGLPGPAARAARAALLREALQQLEALNAEELEEDDRLRAAEASRQLGELALEVPETVVAEEHLERAARLARGGVTGAGGAAAARRARGTLVEVLHSLGHLREATARPALAREAFEEALTLQRDLGSGTDGGGPGVAALLADLGRLLRRVGSAAEARARLDEAIELLRGRREEGDAAADQRLLLARSLLERGHLHEAEADPAAALACFEEALELRRDAIEGRADHGETTPLSDVWLKVGDGRAARGDAAGAGAAFAEAEASARRRYEEDQGAWALRAWRQALLKLADHERAAGEVDAALARYEALRGAFEEQAAADPGQGRHARELYVVLQRIAGVHAGRGAWAEARAAMERALELTRAVAAEGAASSEAQRDVAVCLEGLAQALRGLGERDAAVARAREAAAAYLTLLEADPERVVLRLDVATSLGLAGDVLLEQGEVAAALARMEEALEHLDALAAAAPHERRARRERAARLSRLAAARQRAGDAAGAAAAHARLRELLAAEAAAHPQDPAPREDLGSIWREVARQRWQAGDPGGAVAAMHSAVAYRREAAQLRPGDPVAGQALFRELMVLGEAAAPQGRVEEAASALEEALALAERLEADGVDLDRAQLHQRRGELAEVRGDAAAALAAYDAAAAAAATRVRERPEDLEALRRVVHVEQRRGRVLAGQEAWDEASAAFAEAARAARARFELTGSVEARLELASSRLNAGEMHLYAGALEEARDALTRAGREMRELAGAYPQAAQYARQAAALADYARLLLGERAPATPAEHLEVGYQRFEEQAFAEAVAAFGAALTDPDVAADLERANLYNGACAAARAAAAAEGEAAAELRRQALAWLALDLERWRARLEAAAGRAGLEALRARHDDHVAWAREGDPDLAALRGEPAFEALFGDD